MGLLNVKAKIKYLMLVAYFVSAVSYPIVDTGQEQCYNNSIAISPPSIGTMFYGQDAQFNGNEPSYTISADSMTVYDNVTSLTWMRSPDLDADGDIDINDKLTWAEVQNYPDILNSVSFGGYSDWRVPTIKELYSLIKFNGQDISGYSGSLDLVQPFIDDNIFHFAYGDTSAGERPIDSQYASNTVYAEFTIPGTPKLFGVNFADGRIKGYDTAVMGGVEKTFLFIAVRGNPSYGINDFSDNADGTITDSATGLMWQKSHSAISMSWQNALAYAETLSIAGYNNWRLPNAKELQSIVDYTRSPGTTGAAIDPVFECATITNEAGTVDYPWFWTSTTHAGTSSGTAAVYVCFGRAAGWMRLPGRTYFSYIDVHGAGSQRSDPKTGSPTDYYLGLDSLGHPVYGHGPQGDIIRVNNYIRCVRDISSLGAEDRSGLPEEVNISAHPNPFNSAVTITLDGVGVGLAPALVEIFDLNGRRVAELPDGGIVGAGFTPARNDGAHDNKRDGVRPSPTAREYTWQPASSLGSGVYLVRACSDAQSVAKRIVYIK